MRSWRPWWCGWPKTIARGATIALWVRWPIWVIRSVTKPWAISSNVMVSHQLQPGARHQGRRRGHPDRGAAQNGRGSGGLTPDGDGGGGACDGTRRGRGRASAGRRPDHGRRGRHDSPLSRRVHADGARDGVRDRPAGRPPPGPGHHGCRGIASGHTEQAGRSTDEAPAPWAITHGGQDRVKEGSYQATGQEPCPTPGMVESHRRSLEEALEPVTSPTISQPRGRRGRRLTRKGAELLRVACGS
jgi:hypothetical protein